MPDDDYAHATGHEITCTAGFNDECSCGTAPTGLRDRLAVWARHNALTDLEHPDAIDQLAALVEDEIRRVQDAAATINGMRAKAEARAERAEARIAALEGEEARGSRRTVVEFFLQCQQPDGTWDTASSAMDSQEWAEGRIAKRRMSMPAFGHRVVRRTTTTITSEMEPVELRSNASYPREGEK